MTVVVTVNAPGRIRGFLASCMLEIAPGVYTAPDMTTAVRDRIWEVVAEWWEDSPEATLFMTWTAPSEAGGQAIRTLGDLSREFVATESVVLMRRSDPATS